ncbi:hypothetical protein IJ674_01115 [bacterium]|jgi:hypothetical protein|nr:hypothetical protein [bacterium]
MAILTRIRSVLPSVSSVLTKGAGLAALGIVAYDANYVGKIQSDLYASSKDAQSTAYYLNNSMYMPNMSKFTEKIKNWSFTTELDQTYKRFFNEGIGYIKGFTGSLVNSVIPLGLGAGALFGGKTIGKASAVGLAVYGAYKFIKNFFGIGTPNTLKID